MINCQLCANWHVFDSKATDHYTHVQHTVRVETCKLGLSPIDKGKTVSKFVEKCDAYRRIEND